MTEQFYLILKYIHKNQWVYKRSPFILIVVTFRDFNKLFIIKKLLKISNIWIFDGENDIYIVDINMYVFKIITRLNCLWKRKKNVL